MLPPVHSVTLKPSSLNSPVNSRLTPQRRELQAVWMRRHDVSSLMMVPKCRVLRPVLDTSVLWEREVSGETGGGMNGSLSVHRIADPGDWVAGLMDDFDVSGEVVFDLWIRSACWIPGGKKDACGVYYLCSTVSSDQGHFSAFSVRIHDCDKGRGW